MDVCCGHCNCMKHWKHVHCYCQYVIVNGLSHIQCCMCGDRMVHHNFLRCDKPTTTVSSSDTPIFVNF